MLVNMKKYEYMTERWGLGFFKRLKQKQLVFEELGKEGWELVGVIPIAEPATFTSVPITKAVMGFFKREINK